MEKNWAGLFEVLNEGTIPDGDTGMIATLRFLGETKYAVIEFTPYRTVRNMRPIEEEQGVSFRAEGEKIFVVYEPGDYVRKYDEPYLREPGEDFPLRFSELDVIMLPNNDRLLINRDSYLSSGSVTLQKPDRGDFAMYIFDRGNLVEHAKAFLDRVLHDDFAVPHEPRVQLLKRFQAHVERLHAMDT